LSYNFLEDSSSSAQCTLHLTAADQGLRDLAYKTHIQRHTYTESRVQRERERERERETERDRETELTRLGSWEL
jgi:hypothetical protein